MGHGVSTLQSPRHYRNQILREQITITRAHAFSIVALLYLSSTASAGTINPFDLDEWKSTHRFSLCFQSLPAFAFPSIPVASTSRRTQKQTHSIKASNRIPSIRTSSRFDTRERYQTCFQFFKDQTDGITRRSNLSDDFHHASPSHTSTCENEDALLHRIINGRNSSSLRWRRRTRRAAAALGIPRRCKDGQDYLKIQQQQRRTHFCSKSSNKTTRSSKKDECITLRPVPPLSSTILAEQPDRLRIQKMNSNVFRSRLTDEEHSRAKLVWASKYTSIQNLRQSFGSNRNKLWGDFDAKTTRKLYHTLLPRALLGLYEVGLWSPEEVAPLAFEARLAAKKYARERCRLPGRLAAMVYDGFRSWKTWGTFSVEGMTWDQIWHKYESQILEEYIEDSRKNGDKIDFHLLQEEITAQICLRILERSCNTNEAFDKMLLDDQHDKTATKRRRRRNAERELARIKIKLDRDMEELTQLQLLNHSKQTRKRAAIFAFSSPSFFLDILGGEFTMGSLALSPQNFVKSQGVSELENDVVSRSIDDDGSHVCLTTDLVQAIVLSGLSE